MKAWKDDWKNWMLRTQRAMAMKTLEEFHPYVSVCANIQTSDEGNRITFGYTCSP
jgi:hypothetical protein